MKLETFDYILLAFIVISLLPIIDISNNRIFSVLIAMVFWTNQKFKELKQENKR